MAVSRFNPDYPDAGLVQLVPSSVTVGSGTGTVSGNGTVDFSGASSVSVNTVFSDSYKFYKIVFEYIGTGAGADVRFRWRDNTTDNTGSYYGAGYYARYTGTSGMFGAVNGGAQLYIQPQNTTYASGGEIEMYRKIGGQVASMTAKWHQVQDAQTVYYGGYNATGNPFNGFSFVPTSGNITGQILVYGYRN